jgi:hypothetical protein
MVMATITATASFLLVRPGSRKIEGEAEQSVSRFSEQGSPSITPMIASELLAASGSLDRLNYSRQTWHEPARRKPAYAQDSR